MKKFFILQILTLSTIILHAQNFGIGTATPNKTLSVNGSIAVDHNNIGNGTLEGASLLFGTQPSLVGINSNKDLMGVNPNGMDIWTNGLQRITVLENGNVGIGTQTPVYKLSVMGNLSVDNSAYFNSAVRVSDKIGIGGTWNSNYRLYVNNGDSYFDGIGIFSEELRVGGVLGNYKFSVQGGTSRFDGDLVVSGLLSGWEDASFQGHLYANTMRSNTTLEVDDYVGIGGVSDPNYRLRVWNGNARVGGDFHATGYAAIGGDVDNTFRLRVYDGNSRFGGNVEVTGNMNASQITTGFINGNGVVKSNGSSSLRVGFDSEGVDLGNMSPGEVVDATVNITDFDGNNNDVRVMICQFEPDPLPQYSGWHFMKFFVHSVNADNDTAKIRIYNNTVGNHSFKGTFYVMSVAKD